MLTLQCVETVNFVIPAFSEPLIMAQFLVILATGERSPATSLVALLARNSRSRLRR